MSTEYKINLHVTCEDEERLDNLMSVIVYMLERPDPENPNPDGFGMPGVEFEGMTADELDKDGNVVESFDHLEFGGFRP